MINIGDRVNIKKKYKTHTQGTVTKLTTHGAYINANNSEWFPYQGMN